MRPRTLVVGAIPVLVGTALAAAVGKARPGLALLAAGGALLIQVGTNLTNDYFDFRSGADTGERLGPPRACERGWLRPPLVLSAGLSCFAAAGVLGIGLVAAGGWPILVVGVASVAAGYAYTGGPFPLGYRGLGELFVFVFFGLVAVGGSFYVQARELTPGVLGAAVPVGALATAVLVVNNLRDHQTDALAGKRTLAVRFGPRFAQAEFVGLLALAFGSLGALWWAGVVSAWGLLPLLCLPWAGSPLRKVLRERGRRLNEALAEAARLQLLFGALLAAGVLLGAGRS